jgi:hypothetical protein
MTESPMPTIFIPGWDGETYEVHPRVQRYTNDRLALEFWSEGEFGMEPFGKLTVNLPDVHLNEGEILVKDWAENELMVETLLEAGWITPTGREVVSGFVFPMVARPAGPLLDFLNA